MIHSFNFQGSPAQVVFGCGSQTEVKDWIEKSGCKKALLLSTPNQKCDAMVLSDSLGSLSAGLFAEAAMHTPVEVTMEAMKYGKMVEADCIVSLGGGSTTGLGKAIKYRTKLPQIAIPTTYAGSEATPILGQTEKGRKTTIRDESILPDIIIYDPSLTLELPVDLTVVSGINAMAHAVEALYAKDRNPISSLMAVEGLTALRDSLPKIVESPMDIDARSNALYGAWLCGSVLGSVGMALHHKICHTLGGSFDTPHAETHAIMLPYTTNFNSVAASRELQPVAELFGNSPGIALFDFCRKIGAPGNLGEVGINQSDLDRVAELASENPYWNPSPVTRDSIREMLQDAWEGKPPNQKTN